MLEDDALGTLPLSQSGGRVSHAALEGKRRDILRDLALSPLERVEKALKLGANQRKIAAAHGHGTNT